MKPKSQTILIIAGEESGDIHGGNLIAEILKQVNSLRFYGIGGERMKKAGMELIYHTREMAFLGFFEVIQHLPFIRRVYTSMKKSLDERQPDLVILVDYPGFNLRFAKEAKKRNIPVVYYISPQVWAWKQKRIHTIARRVTKMMVLFPFEVDLYESHDVDVSFIGHPLKDIVKPAYSSKYFLKKYNLDESRPILSIMPGSRKQEIKKLLPEMVNGYLRLKKRIPELQAIIARVDNIDMDIYQSFLKDVKIPLATHETYDVISHSDAALVASGTATLETAILQTPMIILYKINPVSYLIGKALVKLDYFGLVNIVAGKMIIPELLQHQVTGKNIEEKMYPLLVDEKKITEMKQELKRVNQLLGSPGASKRGAKEILKLLK